MLLVFAISGSTTIKPKAFPSLSLIKITLQLPAINYSNKQPHIHYANLQAFCIFLPICMKCVSNVFYRETRGTVADPKVISKCYFDSAALQ